MSQKRYYVKLTERERQYLQKIVRTGKDKARKITRARILLLADVSKGKTDKEISDALDVCSATVFNIRQHYCQGGVEYTIDEDPRLRKPRKFKGKTLARIKRLVCNASPGESLRSLAGRIVERGIVKSISHQGVCNILKKRTQA